MNTVHAQICNPCQKRNFTVCICCFSRYLKKTAHSTPSHCLTQCWFNLKWALRNKRKCNLDRNMNLFFPNICFKILSAKCRLFCLGLNEWMTYSVAFKRVLNGSKRLVFPRNTVFMLLLYISPIWQDPYHCALQLSTTYKLYGLNLSYYWPTLEPSPWCHCHTWYMYIWCHTPLVGGYTEFWPV